MSTPPVMQIVPAPRLQILRFKLTHDDVSVIPMPAGARVLSVACKPGDDCISIWAACSEPEIDATFREYRKFRIVGTGWKAELPHNAVFIGTAIENGTGFGPHTFVWHVFEIPQGEG